LSTRDALDERERPVEAVLPADGPDGVPAGAGRGPIRPADTLEDMGLNALLGSKTMERASTLSMLVEAALSWSRDERRVAVLFLGAAALAYRWSALGLAAEGAVRLYRRTG
jgi:hypothetical protein